MKILVASDIHGRLKRMQHLVSLIDSISPDKIFLLGDYLYNGPRNGVPDDYDPMAVAQLLNPYASLIIGVRGNCDSRIDDTLLSFRLLNNRSFVLDGFHFDLYHGDDYSLRRLHSSPGDILISGHTHLPVLKKENARYYLNPGSISFPKGGNPPSYAVIDGKQISILSFFDGKELTQLIL